MLGSCRRTTPYGLIQVCLGEMKLNIVTCFGLSMAVTHSGEG